MLCATAIDSLLMASPLLLLGGIVMAVLFYSQGEKNQGARFVTGSLLACGLVFGGIVGFLLLAGGKNAWGAAALFFLFVLPFFAFFGLAAGIFICALLGRRWVWAAVAGFPLAWLGLHIFLNEAF